MKKTMISLCVATVVGIAAAGLASGEHDESHESHDREPHGHHDDDRGRGGNWTGSAYPADSQYGLYQAECGGCHISYPPSLLPSSSWRDMMGSLENHFGDNAELDAPTAEQIALFLERNAAGAGRGEYSERSWRATRDRHSPMRITQTDYFRGQHHEIAANMVIGNPEVGSFSRCDACHRRADQGDFDEHGVRIPGYGSWDD